MTKSFYVKREMNAQRSMGPPEVVKGLRSAVPCLPLEVIPLLEEMSQSDKRVPVFGEKVATRSGDGRRKPPSFFI